MYTEFFKLNESPFSLTPDPRYLFMSERHREGLAHLLYGVQQPGGFVMLTGDVGSGKTTLCRCLVKQLPPETDVALILNPRLTVIELLATVCDELRIPYPAETGSVKVLIDALNQRLLESHARGRRTVLLIDEAQNLSEEVLEQIRLLTNLETSKEKLLQIILVGQPELLAILKREKLRQLAQRITARYHLLALTRKETYAYVQHRLLVSGRQDPLFNRGAMRCVYRLSRGVPRVINIICDRALLGAYALDKRRITASIVRTASRETRGVLSWSRRSRLAWTGGILALAAVLIGMAVFLEPDTLPALRRKAVNPGGSVSPPPVAKESVKAVAGKPTKDAPATGATQTEQPLAEMLGSASLFTPQDSAFAALYREWGIKETLSVSEFGCAAAKSRGFDCLFQVGNWLKLSRYDIPAILEIKLPNGVRRQVPVVKLTQEAAVLSIGGKERAFPLWEINQFWDGAFILLWKPPFAARRLGAGDRGKEVLWVRRALDTIEGKKSGSASSELFDADLKQRILAFQREQSLIQDGFVGSETLVRLSTALLGSNAPSLSRRTR